MKGGQRGNSGRRPDPTSLRQARLAERGGTVPPGSEWTDLPATGRTGRVPAWPLTKATPRERTIWNRLWKMPQAIAWARDGSELLVGLYVRRFVEAEQRSSSAALSTLVRQMADSLGLTAPGLRGNRWRIVDAEKAADSATTSRPRTGSPSKARLRVVRGDDDHGDQ